MKRAARKDAIHGAVVNVLTGNGWEVHDLSAVGDGVPDLLALTLSCLPVWIEVKSEPATTRHGSLRASQEAWKAKHPRAPYELVDSVEAAWKLAEKYNPKTRKAGA